MKGGESSLLQPILIALEQLKGGIDAEHTSPTKQHGMPGISHEFTRRKSEWPISRALPALLMLICRTRDCSRQTSAPAISLKTMMHQRRRRSRDALQYRCYDGVAGVIAGVGSFATHTARRCGISGPLRLRTNGP